MAAENGTVLAEQPLKTTGKANETTREYMVLMQLDSSEQHKSPGSDWAIVGRPFASNDGEARKMVGSTLPEDERDAPLVAVPARYWKPKARKVKVTTSESWD